MTGRQDPSAGLTEAAARAAGELDGITSTDPAARSAILAVRLARHTLTSFWLPALEYDAGPPVD